MERTEAELIQSGQAGEAEALTALYQRYVRILFGYLYNKLGSKQDAEDICQEAFTRAFKNIRQYTGKASFKNWLFQIAKNLIADHWAKHYQTKVISVEEFFDLGIDLAQTQPLASDEEPLTNVAAEQTIQRMLAALSEEYRAVLDYRFLRGYTIEETATALGLSISNVKVRQLRALKKAKQLFQDYEPIN